MTETVGNILSSMNPNTLYICAAVLLVFIIISIIKKVVKLAMVLIVIALLFTVGAPTIKSFQENYSIQTVANSTQVNLKIDRQEYNIDLKEINNVSISKEPTNDSLVVNIKYTNGQESSISIPKFMKSSIIGYLKENKINYLES